MQQKEFQKKSGKPYFFMTKEQIADLQKLKKIN